jgi:nitrogen fixation protein NifU and related proteins
MSLDELYQEIVLDHYRRPRNHGALPDADVSVELDNPLCGDEIRLTVRFDQNRIADLAFQGRGCVISQASASLMTEKIKGLTISEAEIVIARFAQMLQPAENDQTESFPISAIAVFDASGELHELNAFKNVCDYPSRVKCAMLAWRSLAQALERRRSAWSH